MLFPVVLAGGVGSRLWPLSRAASPKQFIEFSPGQGSLFQQTLTRLDAVSGLGAPMVVCNADHRFLVAENLRQLQVQNPQILLEPIGRNTAPAVALAALRALDLDPAAQLLVLPADHSIADQVSLHAAIGVAASLIDKGVLVTFGIVPGAPETGYGYIEKGRQLNEGAAFEVERFVEKPSLETAQDYIASGSYLWNSGMFMFQARAFLDELQRHAPGIYDHCREAHAGLEIGADFITIPDEPFRECRSESIDYAIMEHTDQAVVVPLDAGWNDLGSWQALWEEMDKDGSGNVIHGDVLIEDSRNNYVQANSRLVAAVGVEDAVIVETPDAVLVAIKSHAQKVKKIVARLESAARPEAVHHTLVHRPWGSYRSLGSGPGYQVKHIVVKPGAALSLQLHHRRAEHWTVIRGVAQVICGQQELTLQANESVFIPLGSKHRLTNDGETPVEIIEVQVGDYLGEDDIVRFDDRYGRVQ